MTQRERQYSDIEMDVMHNRVSDRVDVDGNLRTTATVRGVHGNSHIVYTDNQTLAESGPTRDCSWSAMEVPFGGELLQVMPAGSAGGAKCDGFDIDGRGLVSV